MVATHYAFCLAEVKKDRRAQLAARCWVCPEVKQAVNLKI